MTAAALVWLLARFLDEDGAEPPVGLLIVFTCAAHFLSFPVVFFFPSVLLAIAWRYRIASRNFIAGTVAVAASFGLNYAVFIRSGKSEALNWDWRESFLDPSHPVYSLWRVLQSLAELIAPQVNRWAVWGGGLAALLCLAAMAVAVVCAVKGSRRSSIVVFAAVLPIVGAVGASFFRLFPLAGYPRMILWMLPGLAMSLAFGASGIHLNERLSRGLAVAALLLGVLAVTIVEARFPRPNEFNREAVEYLRRNMGGDDWLFVHGGVSEQYLYYSRLLGLHPRQVYNGNTEWPCCAINTRMRAAIPAATVINDDLDHAAALSHGHTLWLLVPSGKEGHWSWRWRKRLAAAPAHLGTAGCRLIADRPFDQVRVQRYGCDVSNSPRTAHLPGRG